MLIVRVGVTSADLSLLESAYESTVVYCNPCQECGTMIYVLSNHESLFMPEMPGIRMAFVPVPYINIILGNHYVAKRWCENSMYSK